MSMELSSSHEQEMDDQQTQRLFLSLEKRMDAVEDQMLHSAREREKQHKEVVGRIERLVTVVLEGDRDLGIEGIAFMVKAHEKRIALLELEIKQQGGITHQISQQSIANQKDIEQLMRLRDRVTWTLAGMALNGVGIAAILAKVFGDAQ